ncbi:membrane protein DedA with SNARE-associated domain [Desulfofundulus luciae]|uniref:Membrane protein DedA with SNARE-associated domain n=1 Tax=Desulfofundulus luciae TaxID=74702 RepID=A0ABU0AZS1_9FIRM|nr:DedA family protein [Desulfofundulus luciae]MDQ0285960.1 membrane protein DedA with SNARE-associated domain [Desulfofundulus luciae]
MKDWVLHYLGTLGAGGLFLGLIIEALGIPFPGGLMTLLAGILVNQGRLDFYHILTAAVLGFNVGATAAYLIGRYVGEPFLLRYGKYLMVTAAKFNQARNWMYRSAPAFIIFGRFVPMVSNLTPYLAGISRLPFMQFLIYNSLFALSWVSFNLGIGIFFGHHWESIFSLIQSRLPLLALGVLVAYLIYLFLKQKALHRT